MEKQMIIAISREFGSGGHKIAEKIANDFGLAFYDRKMLDELAKEKNIKIEYLEKYDEKPRNLILSRRVGAYSNSIEEVLADMQFDYIRKKADSGESFIIVGRCAETVLKGRDELISVFVLGDREDKIKRVMERTGLNRDDTIAKMKRHDRTRKMYHNRHSEQKWGDSRNYDLCVNSSKLGLDKTAEVIGNYIKARIEEK